MDDSTKALGLAAAVGFGVLVILLVMLAVTEENLVGTAAGLTGIVTGICLGLFLRRTEPEPESEPEAESEPELEAEPRDAAVGDDAGAHDAPSGSVAPGADANA